MAQIDIGGKAVDVPDDVAAEVINLRAYIESLKKDLAEKEAAAAASAAALAQINAQNATGAAAAAATSQAAVAQAQADSVKLRAELDALKADQEAKIAQMLEQRLSHKKLVDEASARGIKVTDEMDDVSLMISVLKAHYGDTLDVEAATAKMSADHRRIYVQSRYDALAAKTESHRRELRRLSGRPQQRIGRWG